MERMDHIGDVKARVWKVAHKFAVIGRQNQLPQCLPKALDTNRSVELRREESQSPDSWALSDSASGEIAGASYAPRDRLIYRLK